MKTNLCSINFKKIVSTFYVLGIVWISFVIALSLIMLFIGCFQNVSTFFSLLLSFSLPILPFIIIGIHYKRVSNSYVIATANRLLIVDSNDKLWREISYDSIISITIESIATLYQRHNNTTAAYTYICIHTDHKKESLMVPYRHLVKKEHNMFPILFQEEFYIDFLSKFNSYKTDTSVLNNEN